MKKKEKTEMEEAIMKTPEFPHSRRAKDGYRKTVIQQQGSGLYGGAEVSNSKRKRKREVVEFEKEEGKTRDNYYLHNTTHFRPLAASSRSRRLPRLSKQAGVIVVFFLVNFFDVIKLLLLFVLYSLIF
jgi:hypothetical protein